MPFLGNPWNQSSRYLSSCPVVPEVAPTRSASAEHLSSPNWKTTRDVSFRKFSPTTTDAYPHYLSKPFPDRPSRRPYPWTTSNLCTTPINISGKLKPAGQKIVPRARASREALEMETKPRSPLDPFPEPPSESINPGFLLLGVVVGRTVTPESSRATYGEGEGKWGKSRGQNQRRLEGEKSPSVEPPSSLFNQKKKRYKNCNKFNTE